MTRARRSLRAGFTLVEVLLVALIMGMMFVSISQLMQAARRTRDTIHNFQETQLAGPAVLEMMMRDIDGLLTTNRLRTEWLQVTDRTVNGLDADRIDFVTTTDSLLLIEDGYGEPLRADVNEVGYVLRPSETNDEFLEIYRREDFGVDDQPFESGQYTFLSDQVKGLNIEVFEEDGPDAEPIDDWGPQAGEVDRPGLPAFIRISLTIELKPRIDRESMDFSGNNKRTVTYVRSVRFPEVLRVEDGEIARFGIPPAPGASNPGDGAAPGEGEGNEDGNTAPGNNNNTPTGNENIGNGQGNSGKSSEDGRR